MSSRRADVGGLLRGLGGGLPRWQRSARAGRGDRGIPVWAGWLPAVGGFWDHWPWRGAWSIGTLAAMKAAVATRYGPPEVVQVVDVSGPAPEADELLVRVYAATVNRTDCGFRAARPWFIRGFAGIRRPRRTVLGNEFAGVRRNGVGLGFRRTPQTARSRKSREDSESFLTVTHPFHPLAGRRLRVLFERRYKATGVAFCCEGGPLGSVILPAGWTDRGVAASAHPLGYEQLAELAALVRALATRRPE